MRKPKRLYRCPWCGQECLSFWEKADVGSKYRKGNRCWKCREDYGMKGGNSRVLLPVSIVVVLFFDLFLMILYGSIVKNSDHLGAVVLCILLSVIMDVIAVYLFNYFHSHLVRMKDEHYVPYVYQGYMEIIPVDKKARRFIRDGAILAVVYSRDGTGRKTINADERIKDSGEFAFVLSDSIQKYKPTLWEWGFLNPGEVPDELFEEGREVVVIDNGRQIAVGVLTTVFEEFEKQPEAASPG